MSEVVGYAFQAAIWCPDHVREVALARLADAGVTVNLGELDVESALDEWARVAGIARHGADTDEFPHPIFGNEAHDGCNPGNGYHAGQCGDSCSASGRDGKPCGERLGGECPNVADGADPDATLREIRELVSRQVMCLLSVAEVERLTSLFAALDESLENGGDLPDDWQR